jgi:hypothetical protein
LWLTISGIRYKLHSYPPAPGTGLVVIWGLRKIDHDRAEPVAYAVASDGREVKCTCPDHTINGAVCKHIGALVALRLVPAAKGGAR